ncbi:uncharacterized protein LOC144011101 isoform X1 [Festucalex cinctus]
MSIKPENILEAELYKGTFIIRVPDHKTAQSFGPAMVTVNQVTMHCLLKLEKLRPHLRGFHKNPQTFFFNTQGSECVKMGEYFTKAWRQMGLPGKPNLRDIRTAIATWAGRSLAEPETKRINKSMCHDPKTAQKFYMLGSEASAQESHQIRMSILRSLVKSSSKTKRGQSAEGQEGAGQDKDEDDEDDEDDDEDDEDDEDDGSEDDKNDDDDEDDDDDDTDDDTGASEGDKTSTDEEGTNDDTSTSYEDGDSQNGSTTDLEGGEMETQTENKERATAEIAMDIDT